MRLQPMSNAKDIIMVCLDLKSLLSIYSLSPSLLVFQPVEYKIYYQLIIKTAHIINVLLLTDGVFEALIHFSGDYNYAAPKVQFLTIPFHPNGKVQYCTLNAAVF